MASETTVQRHAYESRLARLARRWSLVPIALICGVFAFLVHQTETTRRDLAQARKDLDAVQRDLESKRAAASQAGTELQTLHAAHGELTKELSDLKDKSEAQQKDLEDLKAQGDLLWKLAAKDPPKVVSGKVIKILGAEDPRQRAQTLYLAAKIAMEHRDYPRAESLLEDAIAELPNYAEALNALGLVAARKGRLDDAETLYLRAVTADDLYFYPLQNLAGLYFQQKKYAKARSFTQQALRLKPGHKQLLELSKQIDNVSPP